MFLHREPLVGFSKKNHGSFCAVITTLAVFYTVLCSAFVFAKDSIPDRLFGEKHAPEALSPLGNGNFIVQRSGFGNSGGTSDGQEKTVSSSLRSIIGRILIARKRVRDVPPIAPPNRDRLIAPPGEEVYFPTRGDGQPFVINIDTTINLTDALNSFYFDPKWRGEVWVPFNQFEFIERATRLMSTWPEYDEANQFRKLNKVNKFFERWSGYGP